MIVINWCMWFRFKGGAALPEELIATCLFPARDLVVLTIPSFCTAKARALGVLQSYSIMVAATQEMPGKGREGIGIQAVMTFFQKIVACSFSTLLCPGPTRKFPRDHTTRAEWLLSMKTSGQKHFKDKLLSKTQSNKILSKTS